MVQSQADSLPTIAGFAQGGGVGVETVRYYQRRGLLAVPDGREGVRRYGPEDQRRLRFIRSAQAAGFSLDEVAELIRLDAARDHAKARALARERICALHARIETLIAARAMLTRLAAACASPTSGPCPILSAFEAD